MQTTAPGIVEESARTQKGSALLSVKSVHKNFGRTAVLKGVSLDVAEGEFLTILGESGSGKTTLLRLIAGFEHPDAGEIWMAGERLDTLPPFRRRVNTVFQQYALFPHLSVFDNVAYGLRVGKVHKPADRSICQSESLFSRRRCSTYGIQFGDPSSIIHCQYRKSQRRSCRAHTQNGKHQRHSSSIVCSASDTLSTFP
jgi:ABC-type sugar transport system ATPase subunit